MDINSPFNENIRVDLLKVRQKLSQLYPPNSIGRKKIVRFEKEREIAKLDAALAMFPKNVTNNVVSINQEHMQQVLNSIAVHSLLSLSILIALVASILQLKWFGMLLPLPLAWHIAEITVLSKDWLHHRKTIREVNATQLELERKRMEIEKELSDE